MENIKDYDSLQITEEEKNAVLTYREKKHNTLSMLLMPTCELEEKIITENKNIDLNKKFLEESLAEFKNIFSAIVKYDILNKNTEENDIFAVIEDKEVKKAHSFIFATNNKNSAETYYSNGIEEKAVILVNNIKEVGYIRMSEVTLDLDEEAKNEILIGPFVKFANIEEISSIKDIKYYAADVENEKIKKSEISEEKILKKANEMYIHLNVYIDSLEEYKNLNLKRDMNTAGMSDRSLDKDAKKQVSEDIDKITKDMQDIDKKGLDSKAEYIKWKADVITYLKNTYLKIKEEINTSFQNEYDKNEKRKQTEIETVKNSTIKNLKDKTLEVAKENEEKSVIIQNKLEKIKQRQTTFKEFSEKVEAEYTPYINIDKALMSMKSLSEILNKITVDIKKIEDKYVDEDVYQDSLNKLNKYKKISDYIKKYIDNKLEIGVKNLDVLEVTKLKKTIYLKIEEVKADTNLESIRIQREKLVNRSAFMRIIDQFIGRAEVNRVTLEQLDIKEQAVNEKLDQVKKEFRSDYSIHKMIAEVDIYLDDNLDNKHEEKNVELMQKIKENISNIFMVEDDKVLNIKEEILGSSLPMVVDNKNITKEERVIAKALAWLRKNDYRAEEAKESINSSSTEEVLINELDKVIAELVNLLKQ